MTGGEAAARKRRLVVVAPARSLPREAVEPVRRVAASLYGDAVSVDFRDQCFLSKGHFAGSDVARTEAFVEAANDPAADAVWFARGGYGAGRFAPDVIERLGPSARAKKYLGYSDTGFLLARLYAAGVGQPAHGPMPADALREGGEAAIARALKWLVEEDEASLEPTCGPDAPPRVAFNAIVLAHALHAAQSLDLSGHVLMIEEVAEHLYAFDRSIGAVLSSRAARDLAGVRLGRVLDIPENEPRFDQTPQEIVRFWCDRVGAPFLGSADIGHDAANKVVPFGRTRLARSVNV
ncbi:MAG: LD-carboxypeptidase [Pseudomonadota bacterium]